MDKCRFCGNRLERRKKMTMRTKSGSVAAMDRNKTPHKKWFCPSCKRVSRNPA